MFIIWALLLFAVVPACAGDVVQTDDDYGGDGESNGRQATGPQWTPTPWTPPTQSCPEPWYSWEFGEDPGPEVPGTWVCITVEYVVYCVKVPLFPWPI